MHPFGVGHVLWLLGIATTAIVLSRMVRARSIPPKAVRLGLALFLVGGELQRFFHDGLNWPDGLPFNLCNVTTWMAVYACFSLAPWATEFVYFAGFAGAGMALITPDMGAVWPPRFFVNHGGLIVAAAVLVFGGLVRLRPGAVWRAYRTLAVYICFAGAVDLVLHTNYAYLCRKPGGTTLMNMMGPWPVYLFPMAVMALVMFWALWLVVPGWTPGEARYRHGSVGLEAEL